MGDDATAGGRGAEHQQLSDAIVVRRARESSRADAHLQYDADGDSLRAPVDGLHAAARRSNVRSDQCHHARHQAPHDVGSVVQQWRRLRNRLVGEYMVSRCILTAALSIALVARAGAQQQHPLWHFAADTDVSYFTQTPLGNVLVVSGRSLTAIDPESGKSSWSISDSLGFSSRLIVAIPMTSLLWMAGDDGTGVVDLQTGTWKWRHASPTL